MNNSMQFQTHENILKEDNDFEEVYYFTSDIIGKKTITDKKDEDKNNTYDIKLGEPKLFVKKDFVPKHQSTFKLLQNFEGIILDINIDTFHARIFDLTDEDRPPEEADFYIEDISVEDRDMLNKGAIFYLNIGYDINESGTRKRSSYFRFKRSRKLTNKELEKLSDKVKNKYKKWINEK